MGICSVQPGDLVRSEGGLGAEWSGKEGQKVRRRNCSPGLWILNERRKSTECISLQVNANQGEEIIFTRWGES